MEIKDNEGIRDMLKQIGDEELLILKKSVDDNFLELTEQMKQLFYEEFNSRKSLKKDNLN